MTMTMTMTMKMVIVIIIQRCIVVPWDGGDDHPQIVFSRLKPFLAAQMRILNQARKCDQWSSIKYFSQDLSPSCSSNVMWSQLQMWCLPSSSVVSPPGDNLPSVSHPQMWCLLQETVSHLSTSVISHLSLDLKCGGSSGRHSPILLTKQPSKQPSKQASKMALLKYPPNYLVVCFHRL